jgi:hypothetical protein
MIGQRLAAGPRLGRRFFRACLDCRTAFTNARDIAVAALDDRRHVAHQMVQESRIDWQIVSFSSSVKLRRFARRSRGGSHYGAAVKFVSSVSVEQRC